MELIEVSDRKTRNLFLRVPKILYQKNPFWVCPLNRETEFAFNPEKNKLFRGGNAKRWILLNDNKRLVGRIAAFYNLNFSARNKQPTGGIGWFECINDQGAANLLFDVARDWLKGEGMEAMDGPINFGSNVSNWGLLIAGFTHPGFGMPYNFPYYRELFENYGFKTYFQQYSYHIDITQPFPERFWKIAEWVACKAEYEFRHAEFSKAEKYAQDIITVFNSAWSEFKEDFVPMDLEDLSSEIEQSKTFLEEDLIYFVYHEGKPIAFYIIFPDANQILKHLNGKLHIINKLRFLYHLKIRKITRVRAIAAGVVPKFQNTGIESGIFKHLETSFKKKYWLTEIELSWVGDFNPKMRSLYEAVGGKLAKKHLTLRYLFDPKAKFERFMPDYMENFKKHHTGEFQEEICFEPDKDRPKYNYLKFKEL
ncbi:GNAT family N-acetyltransferase [Bacteroidota bacterium]